MAIPRKTSTVKLLQAQRDKARAALRGRTNQESIYSRGLSGEGYLGGYIAGLEDAMLILNGIEPNRSEIAS